MFMGGHSFGGRMCSHAVVDSGIDCRGLIFCSFPLHQPKKPSVERAAHLPEVGRPMLFLSGTRDDLAAAEMLEGVVAGLDNARIHWLETANHSYVVLKRTRVNPMPVFEEMALAARSFVDEVI
jgi:predicted alpha/beta-hydrolase family hydrolase